MKQIEIVKFWFESDEAAMLTNLDIVSQKGILEVEDSQIEAGFNSIEWGAETHGLEMLDAGTDTAGRRCHHYVGGRAFWVATLLN